MGFDRMAAVGESAGWSPWRSVIRPGKQSRQRGCGHAFRSGAHAKGRCRGRAVGFPRCGAVADCRRPTRPSTHENAPIASSLFLGLAVVKPVAARSSVRRDPRDGDVTLVLSTDREYSSSHSCSGYGLHSLTSRSRVAGGCTRCAAAPCGRFVLAGLCLLLAWSSSHNPISDPETGSHPASAG